MDLFRKFLNLRDAFRATFQAGRWRRPDGELSDDTVRVLQDLKAFCGADQSSIVVAKDGHIDTHATCYAEGKRAVLLRVLHYLNLTDEQLMKLRTIDDE